MGIGTANMTASRSASRSQRTSREGSRSRPATAVTKGVVFVVPAALGFAIAYSILTVMGPYSSTIEHVAWFGIAVLVSGVTSIFAGDMTRLSTREHSERVRAYASLIGTQIGLSDEELASLNWTALLHDIGKLDVPPWILTTETLPSEGERDVLQRHPETARARLRRLEPTLGASIYDGALYHHEQWDGKGYPHQLLGSQIPLHGRITAIANAFDVMTSARSYKKPLPISDARQELTSEAGTLFDPELVAAFLRIGDEDLKAIRGWSVSIAGFALADLVLRPLVPTLP